MEPTAWNHGMMFIWQGWPYEQQHSDTPKRQVRNIDLDFNLTKFEEESNNGTKEHFETGDCR